MTGGRDGKFSEKCNTSMVEIYKTYGFNNTRLKIIYLIKKLFLRMMKKE